MKKTFILSLLFPLLASLCGYSQTIFIAPNATGNGTSWADATGDLKLALASAAPNTEVWVKEGTYTVTSCTNCTPSERNQYFEILNGVRLYGSFEGSETAVSQRNIAEHPTILSGDIDGDGTLTNNAHTIIYTHNVNAETVVDGFVLVGGNADDNAAPLGAAGNSGGGWYNVGSVGNANSHPTIANCNFEGCYAWGYGGGMYNDGSFSGSANPTLDNCIFAGNSSRFGGAGMYNAGTFQGQSNPVLTNCSL